MEARGRDVWKRALAAGRPASFLHVIRPEIDLPESTDEHAD